MKQTLVASLSFLLTLAAVQTASAQWKQTSWPNTCTPYCFAVEGNNIFVGARPSGGITVSTDGGASWNDANNGLTGESVGYIYSFARMGSAVFTETGSGTFVTRDTGKHWNKVFERFGLLTTNGPNIIAATDRGIYLSPDTGRSWKLRTLDTSSSVGYYDLHFVGTNLFAATHAGIFMSPDTGVTWGNSNCDLNSLVTSITSIGKRIVISTFLADGVIAYYSDNNAASWKALTNGLPQTQANKIVTVGNLLFLGLNDGNVYVSADSGAHWNVASTGLTRSSIMSFGITDNDLFVGTFAGGVWSRPLSEFTTSGVAENKTILDIQCYPNPTTGVLHLYASSAIKQIEILNALGQRVMMVSNPSVQSIDLSELPSGLYILKAQTDKELSTSSIIKD